MTARKHYKNRWRSPRIVLLAPLMMLLLFLWTQQQQQPSLVITTGVHAFVIIHSSSSIRQRQQHPLQTSSTSRSHNSIAHQHQFQQRMHYYSLLRRDTTSRLQAISDEHVKKVGGGVALVPPGNRRLFDPAYGGKVGESINQRIMQGSAYFYKNKNNNQLENQRPPIATTSSSSGGAVLGNIEHTRKSGGGIATSATGNRHLFDPAIEGKMVGESINQRILQGSSYPVNGYAASTTTTTTAFTSTALSSNTVSDNTNNALHISNNSNYNENEHVKKAGGGIPLVPPGNRRVFDPAYEGKVGASVNQRIMQGSAYINNNDNNNHVMNNKNGFDTSSAPTTTAIAPVAGAGATTTSSACSDEHVKKAGGGIALVPPGNRRLFDPAVEGKVGASINQRIMQGSEYHFYGFTTTTTDTIAASSSSLSSANKVLELFDTQHWLEDIGIPTNFAKPTAPVDAVVLGHKRLITDDAPGDIQHVVMKLPAGFHYVEGQSLSVIPPGIDDGTGKPYKPRLYSIASTRYGDVLDGTTVSLCVRRAEYTDPVTGKTEPSKAGVCSNYLCNVEAGATVKVAGPVGKTMLLPSDLTKDIIMVGTGTGIAPFRAFLHRLFMENTVARHMYTGKAWLILGVPTTGGLLYHDELMTMQRNAVLGNLDVTYAISREMKNRNGGKMYVQDVLADRSDELFSKLDQGAVIYFCGLKGMMPGILSALEQVATTRGINWTDKLQELMKNHQWHVEVY